MARRRFEPSEQELREWREVEALVLTYQYYLKAEYLDGDEICKSTMAELLKRFNPLFKKYITLIKQNQIDFNDMEHMALQILMEPEIDENGNKIWKPTKTAQHL